MNIIMDCPKDLAIRANILYKNGFGFQGPIDAIKNKFVFCFCRQLVGGELSLLQNMSGVDAIEWHDYMDNECLTVDWLEYDKIPEILTCLLHMGISFTTNNSLHIQFDATVDKQYTREIEEDKAVQFYSNPIYEILVGNFVYFQNLLDIWNWKTDNGKKFCRTIRQKCRLPEQGVSDKNNYYRWPIFQNYDPETLLTIENAKIKEEVRILEPITEDEEEENVCLICFVNEPNTRVLPCKCCVVCTECSEKLKNTNDKKTCVKCRRPIDDIEII